MTELPRLERSLYFLVWTAGILYSIYKVYIIGNNFIQNSLYDDFSPGWPLINRMKDISDYEWNLMIPLLLHIQPWFYVHILINEIFRWKWKKYLSCSFICSSSCCIIYLYGASVFPVFCIQPVIFYIALQFKSKIVIWLTSMLFLTILNKNSLSEFKEVLHLSEDSEYLISVTLAWIHLRCISFCLDKLAENNFNNWNLTKDFLSMLSYILYLPLLFCGPVILYKDFEIGASKPFSKWNEQRLLNFAVSIVRYFWWLVFNEISLHFIYSSALAFQPEVVYGMDSWTLFGFGYCMGQFFMNKYTVLYGIPATFSRLEQIDAPPHPKCIGRIHLYSDMWKYFDVGLYSFLVRYIYVPACGNSRNLKQRYFASFLCFTFVYIWHGTNAYILVWSTLNFLGITIEGMGRTIYSTPSYQQWKKKWFTPRGSRRFHAMVASPLLMMSALSNFYFFGGMEIGNIFVQKILEGWNGVTLVVIAFLYCCCQVSIEVKDWEKKQVQPLCKKSNKLISPKMQL